jgi:phenylacetic acid degradation operon negative regulatory protein
MKMLTSNEWIARFLTTDPPRSKSLVMTIFGDAIAPHGARLWLGSLIELVAPMGATDRLVRTSVFRLAQEGWLVASREGRRSSYALLPEARPRFERANRRIYAPPGLDWDGRWTLVMAPNGSIDASLRARCARSSSGKAIAMLAPGLLAHPAADAATLAEILRARQGNRQDLRLQRRRAAGVRLASAGRTGARRLGTVRRGGRLPPLHRRIHAAAGAAACRNGTRAAGTPSWCAAC